MADAAHLSETPFSDLPLAQPLQAALAEIGFTHCTPIQAQTLPKLIAGRDIASKYTFVGSALHFHSIEWAISLGYLAYDFCHGNEQYKYSYGVSDQEVLYFSVRRKEYAPEMMFDSIGTGEALRRTADLIEKGKTRAAKIACRKLAGLLS